MATYTYDDAGNLLSVGKGSTATTLTVGDFSPNQAPIGATVTLNGTGFSPTAASNTVKFNGVAATVTSASVNQLVVNVPAGASTGPVSIQNANGIVATSQPFTVGNSLVPTITSFSPLYGAVGSAITINGTGFQTPSSANSVTVGRSNTNITSATASALVVPVPNVAATGPITVQTPYGQAISSDVFVVVPAAFNPALVGATGKLAVDGAVTSISLPVANTIALLTFNGQAGQLLDLAVTNLSFANATLTVLKPDGSSLATGAASANGALQLPVLPQSGTYTVIVNPSANTGSIGLQLFGPLQAGVLASGGTATNVAINPVGRRTILTFAGAAGSNVDLSITNNTLSSGTVSVLDPNGHVVISTAVSAATAKLSPTLPMAGTYQVLINPAGAVGGGMSLALAPTQVATLAVDGAAVSQQFTSTTPSVQLTFSGAAGQQLNLTVSGSGTPSSFNLNGTLPLTIKNPDGSVLVSTTATASCLTTTNTYGTYTNCSLSGNVNLPALPASGTYTALLQQPSTGGSGAVTFQLSTPAAGTAQVDGAATSINM
ncbi:IPT/TIG domain-containing protein, partial [Andreprevotia chitinilytica]|uniref:IPT/TIG domain-containing protein n=1 Tax=Andreprevotia chitinilytica TaxID=396808 RepID=UPI001FDFDB86